MLQNIFHDFFLPFLHWHSKSFQVFLIQISCHFIVPRHESLNFLHSSWHLSQKLCPILCHNDIILDPDSLIVIFVSTNHNSPDPTRAAKLIDPFWDKVLGQGFIFQSSVYSKVNKINSRLYGNHLQYYYKLEC